MVLHQSRQDKDALIEVERKMVFGRILKVEPTGLADGLNGVLVSVRGCATIGKGNRWLSVLRGVGGAEELRDGCRKLAMFITRGDAAVISHSDLGEKPGLMMIKLRLGCFSS